MADFETIVADLRRWTAMQAPHGKAATELLLKDETWLRRRDFQAACIHHDEDEGIWWIRWLDVKEFLETRPRAHSTALTMLRLALSLAFDDLSLLPLGRVHRQWVVSAFAQALEVEKPDASRGAGSQYGNFNTQVNTW